MDNRTNVTLVLYVYPGHFMWHIQETPLGRPRRLIARGHYLEDAERPCEDPYEALLLAALEAYRLHGHLDPLA